MAVLPFLALNPPTDGTTDALPWFQQAIAALARQGGRSVLDLGGLSFTVSQPIENTVAYSQIVNGKISPIGTRAAWAGGAPDKGGLPMQKGVIRCRANGQSYENVTLFGGPAEIIEIVEPNCVYTQRRMLANGFEDAPVGSGNKAYGLGLHNCTVNECDYYSFRYSSETGGGYSAVNCRSIKLRAPTGDDSDGELPADWSIGAGFLIDANDGEVDGCNSWNGEYQIWQRSGGTIRFHGNHTITSKAIYKRRYYGPAGVPIETGIQIRTPAQIGTYDNTKVTVARRASDWQVIVTPLENISLENAVLVRIRRDEVNIYTDGWGGNYTATYLDGGTFRCRNPGVHFDPHTNYALPGAMSGTARVLPDLVSPTLINYCEFQPRNASTKAPQNVGSPGSEELPRIIPYPRLGQTEFSAANLNGLRTGQIEAQTHTATIDGVETLPYDADETIVVDTATLTGNRDLRIKPRYAGVPGGFIRIYSRRSDSFVRNLRINTAAAFATIPAQSDVELWWNGTTWIVLRNNPPLGDMTVLTV